jgi:hypothetical protein
MKRWALAAAVAVGMAIGGAAVAMALQVRKQCDPMPLNQDQQQLAKRGGYPAIELNHSDVLERLQVTVGPNQQPGKYIYTCR